jgi:hypothetical protein
LAAGELGFETDTGKFKIGTGASTWTALLYAGGGQSTLTTYQYTATASQTTFSGADSNALTLAYTVGSIQVYLNGALLANTTDYAATTGTSVVLSAGAGVGDSLTILSLATFEVANTYTQAQSDALFIPDSIVDAKGDLIAATAADAVARIAIGANNTVLTADSAEATGMKWAAAAGGGGANWSLLNAGGTALNGAGSSLSISGISDKEQIMVLIQNASTVTAGQGIDLRVNGNTGSIYTQSGMTLIAFTPYVSGNQSSYSFTLDSIIMGTIGGNTASTFNGAITLTGCKSAGYKQFWCSGSGDYGYANQTARISQGVIETSAAITSINVTTTNTFDAGTVFVYTTA